MNENFSGYCLALLVALTACGRTTIPGNSRPGNTSAVNYNSYNEDLSPARPTYTVDKSTLPAPAPAPPVRKPDPTVAPTPKPAPISERISLEAMSVNKRLDALLDTIAQRNRAIRYAAGYRVQVYVGNERQDADAAKLQVYRSFPELSPYLSYKQPTYRLKVGDFMRRMDADWYLSQLKQQFTSVILQPDKVDVRRSLLIK